MGLGCERKPGVAGGCVRASGIKRTTSVFIHVHVQNLFLESFQNSHIFVLRRHGTGQVSGMGPMLKYGLWNRIPQVKLHTYWQQRLRIKAAAGSCNKCNDKCIIIASFITHSLAYDPTRP